MKATTVLLPPALRARIRAAAARQGISSGEFLRRAALRAIREVDASGPGKRSRHDRLPDSVFDLLAAPAGTYAHLALDGGDAGEAEDPYADVD